MENRGTPERYLHTILMLRKKYCCVRSVDVAHCLKRSKPSVSAAVSRLVGSGLLRVEEDGNLLLTEQGMNYMRDYLERSRCFQRLLLNAGVSPDAAETEAFSMALAVRPETFEALKKYLAMP